MIIPSITSLAILLTVMSMVLACDTFEGGDDVNPGEAIEKNVDLYTMPSTAIIIDLGVLASGSFQSTVISVKKHPSKAYVSQLDAQRLVYRPNDDFTEGTDELIVVEKIDAQVIARYQIKINMATSATEVPCSLIAMEDRITIENKNITTIPILENDVRCGPGNEKFEISIAIAPASGTVEIVNDKIVYTPSIFFYKDQLVYQITNNADDVSYGLVTLSSEVKISTPLVPVAPWNYEPNVFVVGYYNDVATVWGDGQMQALTAQDNLSHAKSVFVDQQDVYVAGYEFNWDGYNGWYHYPERAIIWKNGIAQTLTDGKNEASAASVYVSNGNVFVAGFEAKNRVPVAKLWKNGTVQHLTVIQGESHATSVFVAGEDVYVAGDQSVDQFTAARLWKNGVPLPLEVVDGSTFASSVFVDGSDVYLAGYGVVNNTMRALVWKNGKMTVLQSGRGSYANSIVVRDGDIHICGFQHSNLDGSYGPTLAVYWKNGQYKALTNGDTNAMATSVVTNGNDVFVVGYDGVNGTVWKNGLPTHIASSSSLSGIAIKQ